MKQVIAYLFSHICNSFSSVISIIGYAVIIWILFALFCYVRETKFEIGLKKIILLGLLSLNISFIFFMTLLGRNKEIEYMVQISLLASYIEVFEERDVELLLQIIMNIVMCIPLGVLLPCCFSVFRKYRYVVLVGVSSSFCIELMQLILKIGLFEVDDIFNNTLGVIIGLAIYIICVRVKTLFWGEKE